jgi:hypothetical protein
MATKNRNKNDKRPSIEEKICNMLEKILDESVDEDEERDKMTALTTVENSSINFTTLDSNMYQRKEKKTQSQKEKKIQIDFNQPFGGTNDDEMNYEQLYAHQKNLMQRQKKFKTTTFKGNMMLLEDGGYMGTPMGLQGSPNMFAGNTNFNLLTSKQSMPKRISNKSLLYQTNVLTIKDGEGIDNILTDKNDQITPDLYSLLKGNFSYLIKTQNGSRILQNCLGKTNHEIISLICNEILTDLQNLMIDCYGNYFCQKFYSYVSHEERLMMLIQLKKHILQVSNNSVGTYPLQSIIEKAGTADEKMIICEAISNDYILKDICSDQQGIHVIEKVIVCFKEETIPFVYDYILRNFTYLANTSTGLVICKKIIIHTSLPQTLRHLQVLLVNNFNELIQNAFGNYTIQVALDVRITH